MHATTGTSPSLDIVKTAASRLAPLLIRRGLHLTVSRGGIVEISNTRDSRMRQPITLRHHNGGLWWCWLWDGPTRDAPLDVEPMVPADDVTEAARRIGTVLRINEPDGASR